jgi:lipooligosaccharide transport system ATP-binding protein
MAHEDLGHRLIIYGHEGSEMFQNISKAYCDEGCILRMATLEDVFLKLTGRGLRE